MMVDGMIFESFEMNYRESSSRSGLDPSDSDCDGGGDPMTRSPETVITTIATIARTFYNS
jgi:hypothetical protein